MAKKQKENGSALIFTLVLVLVLSVMGTSMLFLSQSETWSSMNYRMMSATRYGAESGMSVAADYIVNNYTPPSASGTDPLTNYNTSVSPVTYNGQPVTLSSLSGRSNYPSAAVVSAFQTEVNNPGSVQAGGTTITYTVTATLMSMGTVMSYGNPITVQMWQVTADGAIQGIRSSKEEVTAILERQVTPSTVYAAFATSNGCGSISFSGGGQTDSYNSTLLLVNSSGVATAPTTFNHTEGTSGRTETWRRMVPRRRFMERCQPLILA